jgi:hypothetical protein
MIRIPRHKLFISEVCVVAHINAGQIADNSRSSTEASKLILLP